MKLKYLSPPPCSRSLRRLSQITQPSSKTNAIKPVMLIFEVELVGIKS